MIHKALILYMQGHCLSAGLYEDHICTARLSAPLADDCTEQIARMAAGAELALCPGGCVGPLPVSIRSMKPPSPMRQTPAAEAALMMWLCSAAQPQPHCFVSRLTLPMRYPPRNGFPSAGSEATQTCPDTAEDSARNILLQLQRHPAKEQKKDVISLSFWMISSAWVPMTGEPVWI